MQGNAILNTRKRVLIALVHTLVFLGVAAIQVAYPPSQSPILTAVYALVTTALTVLLAKSGATRERLYFGCCTASAALGLGRQIIGDPSMHAAVYLRVLLLAGAAVIGWSMLRAERQTEPSR